MGEGKFDLGATIWTALILVFVLGFMCLVIYGAFIYKPPPRPCEPTVAFPGFECGKRYKLVIKQGVAICACKDEAP